MAHVLLIEPDRDLSLLYVRALEHAGHSVYSTATIQRAVSLLDSEDIDVMILELQLAQHNGIELLYEMRSYVDWNRIRIIIQSSIPEHKTMNSQTMQHLHVDQYLYKPKATLFELCTAVQKTLNRQKA